MSITHFELRRSLHQSSTFKLQTSQTQKRYLRGLLITSFNRGSILSVPASLSHFYFFLELSTIFQDESIYLSPTIIRHSTNMADLEIYSFANPDIEKWKKVINKDKWWNKTLDPNGDSVTNEDINTYILSRLFWYGDERLMGAILWESFKEDFEGWNIDNFKRADKDFLKMRNFLLTRGVLVQRQPGVLVAKTLANLAMEEKPSEWTNDEIRAVEHSTLQWAPGYNPIVQHTANLNPAITHANPVNSNQGDLSVPLGERTPFMGTTPASRLLSVPPGERTLFMGTTPASRLLSVPPGQNQNPIPSIERDNSPLYSTPDNFHTKLTAISKLYWNDKDKYSGEMYDVLDIKLEIFRDICKKVGITKEQYHDAFSSMLRARPLRFYYDSLSNRGYDFDTMIHLIKLTFETQARKQEYLTAWRDLTLRNVINKHPEKSLIEYFEISLDQLTTIYRALSTGWGGCSS